MIYFNKRLYECHGSLFVIEKQTKHEALFVPVKKLFLGFFTTNGEKGWDYKERYKRVKA